MREYAAHVMRPGGNQNEGDDGNAPGRLPWRACHGRGRKGTGVKQAILHLRHPCYATLGHVLWPRYVCTTVLSHSNFA